LVAADELVGKGAKKSDEIRAILRAFFKAPFFNTPVVTGKY
jgi:hypothetical protein